MKGDALDSEASYQYHSTQPRTQDDRRYVKMGKGDKRTYVEARSILQSPSPTRGIVQVHSEDEIFSEQVIPDSQAEEDEFELTESDDDGSLEEQNTCPGHSLHDTKVANANRPRLYTLYKKNAPDAATFSFSKRDINAGLASRKASNGYMVSATKEEKKVIPCTDNASL